MTPAGININVRNVGEARAANIASQRLSAASGQGFLPGICRFCGCTESMPCTVQFNPPAYCSWFDAPQNTVCSAAACIDAALEEEEAQQ